MKSHLTLTLAAGLLLSVLFSGCSGPQVQYYPLNNPTGKVGSESDATVDSPTDPSNIDIYVAKRPTQPFTEMGILTFTTASSMPNEGAIYEDFRQKAAAIGADAVIVLPSREQNEAFWQSTGYPYDWYTGYGYGAGYSSGYSVNYTTFRGLAIKYK